ncbi:HAMP domain-containing sensor histidine kinase [Virgibacillus necropolis]|uniref:Signal transduction histidine-protein kinase ArlS n=1 Tax=Virgibacillus necropolis TaxID=163877 RepID=A0A221MGY8_9BACI|nr:HAMP domain-containing histidine kinase [Virgibacillus necropolis]ASN06890.1 two-component sensor histidine kinase [Virgibacillus necropolis]
MGLRTRIQMSTTVLLIVLLVIANTSIYLIFKHNSIESEQNRLVNTASNIIEELNTNKQSTIEQVLHSYLITDGMIRIVNHKNNPIYRTTTDNAYKEIKSIFRNDQYQDVVTYMGSKFIIVSIPIIDEKGNIISLQIIENVDAIFSNFDELKGVLVLASVVVITMLFIAGWILGGIISRPVQRLISTMKTIEENESYEQIAITESRKDELIQLAMSFNRMIAKLEKSYLTQEQFVSDASHELKTPLTVILSYVKLLKRWGIERPEVKLEAINAIESESVRMKYLTEQLLQLASAEKLTDSEKERANIVPLIDKTIKRIQPMYKNNIQFISRSAELYVNIHEQSFTQLLIILLDNANKYSSDIIKLTLIEEKDILKIRVEDKGIGIPEEEQPYIFDRMYRVDKTRNRKTGGTGLGLAIAKRISEQHGGYIMLESTEKIGSIFLVILPRSEV